MQSYFPDAFETSLALCEHWASTAVALGGSTAEACAAWQELLSRPELLTDWAAHQLFLAWQSRHGIPEAARDAHWEMLKRKRNVPSVAVAANIAKALLDFELMFGSAHDEQRARQYLAKVQVAAAQENSEQPALNARKLGKPEEAAEEEGVAVATGKKRPRAGKEQARNSKKDGGRVAAQREQAHFTDENTVFVKHLSDSVTAEDLKELFQVLHGTPCWSCQWVRNAWSQCLPSKRNHAIFVQAYCRAH
jgi:hypothetical protein